MSSRDEEERIVHSMVPIMLGKLRANATKAHWLANISSDEDRRDKVQRTMELVFAKLAELAEESAKSDCTLQGMSRAPKIRSECADVMNLLAMIADLAGCDSPDAI